MSAALQRLMRTVHAEARLDEDSPTPLYRRLQRGIRRAVEQGAISIDEALPAERELAAGLGVSRVTVRSALRHLVREGLLTQQRGAGTFVARRIEQPLSKLTGFTEDIRSRGLSPGTRWLDRALGAATPEEALALDMSPGAAVARLHRVRLADGRAMCIEQATLPASALSDPGAVDDSLYTILEQLGHRPVRALQRLRAQLLDGEQARLLEVPPGTACLYIERRSFLENGTTVEFVRSHYRGDSYDFVAELRL